MHGFTLLEVLVAISLLALLASALFEGLRLTMRAAQAESLAADGLDEVVLAQRFLRRSLERAYPYLPSAEAAAPLEGDATAMEYSAPAPEGLPVQGFYRYRLALAASRGDHAGQNWEVFYRVDRNGRPAAAPGAEAHETLLAGIDSVTVDYLERDAGGATRWLSSWHGRPDLPRLVRVAVRFPPSDRRRWPPFLVRPRIEANAQCEFDPVSQRCRGSS